MQDDDQQYRLQSRNFAFPPNQDKESDTWASEDDRDDRMRNRNYRGTSKNNPRFNRNMSKSPWRQQNSGDKDDRIYPGPATSKYGDSDQRRRNSQTRSDKDERQQFRQMASQARDNNETIDVDDRPMRNQPIIRYNKVDLQDTQRKRQWNSGPGDDSNNFRGMQGQNASPRGGGRGRSKFMSRGRGMRGRGR